MYVANRVGAEQRRYAFTDEDIQHIVHLIDTDGAFIPDNCIHQVATRGITYYSDCIETDKPDSIKQRNKKKQEVVASLCSTSVLKGSIPYSTFYFSRNMEHVLHNRSENLTDDEKVELADEFADRYEQNPESFVQLLRSDEIAVSGKYGETWKFIRKDTHSLERHSNMYLLFDDL